MLIPLTPTVWWWPCVQIPIFGRVLPNRTSALVGVLKVRHSVSFSHLDPSADSVAVALIRCTGHIQGAGGDDAPAVADAGTRAPIAGRLAPALSLSQFYQRSLSRVCCVRFASQLDVYALRSELPRSLGGDDAKTLNSLLDEVRFVSFRFSCSIPCFPPRARVLCLLFSRVCIVLCA